MIKSLSNYLEKYEGIEPSNSHIKLAIASLIRKELSVELDIESISITRKIITISVSPLVKQTIFRSKNIILEKLSEEFGELAPKDIR